MIETKIDRESDSFKKNHAHYKAIVADYQEKLRQVKTGGSDKAKQRVQDQGKLLVRDRIEQLIDKNAVFLELSALAGFELYDFEAPAAGIITGIAPINGVICMIMANDPTVKGGAYFPITLKKQLRAQAIAEKLSLPCVYLVDSAGAFLPMQDEVFPDENHFGRLFYNEAKMSAKKIPQIAVVLGLCTAGGAYIPAMADVSIMVKDQSSIFLGGPPLVKAATGENISAEELGGAKVHCEKSGVADYMADSELHALSLTRDIIGQLNLKKSQPNNVDAENPLYPADDMLGILQASSKQSYDTREIIARLVDGSDFNEFKALFGSTLICGFAKIEGYLVGIIANNGILFSESAQKAAHFIQLCEKRNIPLLFLQNINGFMVGKDYEAEGIAKHGAKMVNAVACAKVPKLTVVIGGSYGAGNYAMCGRAYDPTFMWMWPNARISVMGGEQAANVLTQIKADALAKKGQTMDPDLITSMKNTIQCSYDQQSHSYYASARCWDDGIIAPQDTRKVLALALNICTNHYPAQDTQYGIFRM
jgi:3-methylcrotonyl-CoA carboxylase beta subunit